MKRTHRALGLIALLLVTGGICVQYAAADHWTYPGPDDLAAEPETHDGETVFLFGYVEAVDRDTGEIDIVVGSDPELELTVENVAPDVAETLEADGSVQVYGAFDSSSETVVAEATVVDYRGTADRFYVYLSSILGGLLAAGYFLWYWRIDFRNIRFVRRGER